MTKIEQQVKALKVFKVKASIRQYGEDKLIIDNGYIGKGVSLVPENGEIKLSLTGGWFNLTEIREYYQALRKGITILVVLSEITEVKE